jgi:biotin carboxyl carrier protein
VSAREASEHTADPRAVRVVVLEGIGRPAAPEPAVLEPTAASSAGLPDGLVIVDGQPLSVRVERLDPVHAVVVEGIGNDETRSRVLILPVELPAGPRDGLRGDVGRHEVVVDGWRIEVEVESAWRAALRDRARRDDAALAHTGPTELRAVIPGRILTVHVVPGDAVVAGQQLMVIEAMKMQNELRAPRDGVVARVEAIAGRTVEVGDLLLALE